MSSSIGGYLRIILMPFFRWWWAGITGAGTLIAFAWTTDGGITLSRPWAIFLVFTGLTLVFLTASVVTEGWKVFSRSGRLEVLSVHKGQDFAAEWVFVLSGQVKNPTGVLVEVRRPLDEIEVPFAVLEIVATTEQGTYQAVPRWMSAGHLRDFADRKFSPRVLIADPHLHADRLQKVAYGRA